MLKSKMSLFIIVITIFLFYVFNNLHADAGTWTQMDSGVNVDLLDIWGSSGKNVFAVGKNGTILHYDGNTWSKIPTEIMESLNGVWGSSENDIFVANNDGDIILRRRGVFVRSPKHHP